MHTLPTCVVDTKHDLLGNPKNMTPLHATVLAGSVSCARLLLLTGANRELTNSDGKTAQELAREKGRMELANFIADFSVHGCAIEPQQRLEGAVEEKKEQVIKQTAHRNKSISVLQHLAPDLYSGSDETEEKKKRKIYKLKDLIIQLEETVQSLNNQIASSRNAKERKNMIEMRQEATQQLLESVQRLLQEFSDSLDAMRTTYDDVNRERTAETLDEQITAVEVLHGRCQGMMETYKQFIEDAPKVHELVNLYSLKRLTKTHLEEEECSLETQLIKCRRVADDEDLDDDERDAAQIKCTKLEKQKGECRANLLKCEKELNSTAKDLTKYHLFGEVKRLIKIGTNDKLSLQNYTFVRALGGRTKNVSLYERKDGELCVLKKFFFTEEHSMIRRESIIRDLPRNPFIIPINEIFTTNEAAYVETPYIAGGTLKEWIKHDRTAREIQNIVRLIAQAIYFLHSHDVIHCDVRLENIVIKQSGDVEIPMLYDFELSRDVNKITTNTTIRGSYNYMPPELLSGTGKLSYAVDIWAFGIIIYELFAANSIQVFLSPDDQALKIESHMLMEEIRYDTDLSDLLGLMLKVKPEERMRITDVVNHNFMTKVLDTSHVHQKGLHNQDRIDIFKQFIQLQSRKTYTQELFLNIVELVDDVLHHFGLYNGSDLMKRLNVFFLDEEGSDAGALTTALYTRFMQACVGNLVTTIANNGCTLYVPSVDTNNCPVTTKNYETLGKVLVKALFDQRTIPISFAPFVWRYILSKDPEKVSVTLRDLDMVDFEHAGNLRTIMTGTDVECLYMDFSDIDPGNSTPLTNSNKREFLEQTVRHKLINSRRNNLEALRRGFRSIPLLEPHLNQLTEVEMAVMINEQRFVDVDVLVSCLHFVGVRNEEFNEMVVSVVREMSQQQISQFLHFATGQVALYSSGIKTPLLNPNESSCFPRNKITFNVYRSLGTEERLPVAHVCFYEVDIPIYSTFELCQQKLVQAIELAGSDFLLV